MRMSDEEFYEIWDKEAIEVLTTPKPVVRHKETGWILLNHCEVEEVKKRTLARFLELREKDPKNIGYRYAIAELYGQLGDRCRSLSEYGQIVEMDPGEYSARTILVNSYWLDEYEENGAEDTDAKELIFSLYRKLIDEFPEHEADLRNAYGERLFFQNRLLEAAEQLNKIDCARFSNCRILGICLVNEERYSEAIAPLESSTRHPHQTGYKTYQALAIALEELGRHDEATKRWEEAETKYYPDLVDHREWKKDEKGKWKYSGPAPGLAY